MTPIITALSFPLTSAIRSHVEARVATAIRRVAAEILDVTVRLRDVNGPRGGADKACQIVTTLRHERTVVVEALDVDLYVAVDRASALLRDQVCRQRGRRRSDRHWAQKRHPRQLLA